MSSTLEHRPPWNGGVSGTCYRTKFRRCRLSRFGVYVGVPKNWGLWGPTPWMGTRPTKNRLLRRTCYHFKFCRCRSSRFGLGKVPKMGRRAPWDVGVADPLEICCSLCHRAKFSHSRSRRSSVIMDIFQKILTPHASPFKVIYM